MKHFIVLFVALVMSGSYLLFKPPHNKKVKTVNTPSRTIANTDYCLLCQFKPVNFPNASSQKTCDDLFASACSSPSPVDDINAASEESQYEAMRERQDKAAQAMGFKNFDDGLKKRLAASGIRINPKADPEAWEAVRNSLLRPASQGPLRSNQIPTNEVFSDTQNCYTVIGHVPPPTSEAETRAAIDRAQNTVTQYQQSIEQNLISAYSQNLPFFVEDNISNICQQYQYAPPEMFNPNDNPQQEQHCTNIENIRREAIMLYREEGTTGYDNKAKEFVRRYLLPPLQHSYTPPSQAGSSTGTAGLSSSYLEISRLTGHGQQLCEQNSSAIVALAQNVAQQYAQEVNSSRTHVEQTINAIYGDSRRNRAQQVLDTLRSDMQAFTSQITSDTAKQTRIIDGYNNVELFWLERPAESAYTTNQNGTQVLSDAIDISREEDSVQNIFSDPSLSFFTNQNAYYSPQVVAGTQTRSEHINFYPAYLELLDSNPFAFSSIMAHELGHKIGPKMSATNGHDLRPEYSELLQCYRDRRSIRMANGQEDEVIADYISSEIMAQQVARLPASQRRSAFMAMASTFCDNGGHSPINCTATHPEGVFRVNGILAGNPNVRRVMGCSAESPNFRTCGLQTTISTNDNSSTPSSNTQDVEEAGGVQ